MSIASYSYDSNANMLSFERRGITDVVSGYEYGVHNSVSMSYTDGGNRLSSIDVTREGADYERRTGLAPTDGPLGGFVYDANGNLICDPSRDIVHIRYNHLNLPVDIRFGNGQRQTIGYDGAGRKLSVEYSQTTHSVVLGAMPDDDDYTVTSVRRYVGPHIFTDGVLEYSGFENGYFDPAQGVMYYAADWQGNNIGVYTAEGRRTRNITYYPYGEPTIEPVGERFLFGGKEREHGGGRNSYDFGARILSSGAWTTPDPLAEKFYPLSPYTLCASDPINHVDRDGKVALPIITGLISAGIDFATQISLNMINGQSFTEAIFKVDGTSLISSFVGGMTLNPTSSIFKAGKLIVTYLADAVVDIRFNGSIKYVGGDGKDTNKSIANATIDFVGNFLPDFCINHKAMKDLPVSSVVDNGTREWTKNELDGATKVVAKINAEGANTIIEYKNNKETNQITAPTDAIGSERRVPSINSDYYEKILRKDKESFE